MCKGRFQERKKTQIATPLDQAIKVYLQNAQREPNYHFAGVEWNGITKITRTICLYAVLDSLKYFTKRAMQFIGLILHVTWKLKRKYTNKKLIA